VGDATYGDEMEQEEEAKEDKPLTPEQKAEQQAVQFD
jgi:hypothetical protein